VLSSLPLKQQHQDDNTNSSHNKSSLIYGKIDIDTAVETSLNYLGHLSPSYWPSLANVAIFFPILE